MPSINTPQLPIDWGESAPPREPQTAPDGSPPRGYRSGTFAKADAAKDAAVVRGVLISRLDDGLGGSEANRLARDFGLSYDQWLELVQRVQLILFPEEFADPPHPPGLVPAAGTMRGVGPDRLANYARLLETVAGR